MPTIVVSSAWAEGGQTKFEVSEGPLLTIIEEFAAQYPAYRRRLLDESGKAKTFFNIYVDDEDVHRSERAGTTVSGASIITIIPPLAGG